MSISKHGTLNKIELAKSHRDHALAHASTLAALVTQAAIGGVVVYFTGAEFAEYMTELGVAGFIIQKLVQDSLVPYLNRKFNIKRI